MMKRYQLPTAEVQRWGEGQGGAAQPEQSEQPRCAAGAFWSGRRHAARSQRRRGEEGRPGSIERGLDYRQVVLVLRIERAKDS
jgi:hypothetical protein